MIRKVQQRARQIAPGFKSQADDYLEDRLEVVDKLVVDPHSIFCFLMASQDMQRFQIQEGAINLVQAAQD